MQLSLSADDFKPLLEQAIAAVLDRFGDPQRIAYPENEAAKLLGVKGHVLRDARLRKEINASKIGRGFSYSREDLIRWFESRRVPANQA